MVLFGDGSNGADMWWWLHAMAPRMGGLWKRGRHPLLHAHAASIRGMREAPGLAERRRHLTAAAWADAEFTAEWATDLVVDAWLHYIATPGRSVRSILEVGTYEGRWALLMAEMFAGSKIACVDSFAGGDEHQRDDGVAQVERRFDANTARLGARVEKLKGRSDATLVALAAAGRRFDLCYIDAGHFHDDVIVDSILAWSLLDVGGILVWDDYGWDGYPTYFKNVRAAIDRFVDTHRGEYEVLVSWPPVAIRKTAETRRDVRT
ncbi:MAG: class I SAM-dependent methyltransferase [Alphaproteobacteria bacterium]|nr:class I SAM-dependent methyltransferase [Alphaproteobacteria bacterium]MCW5743689.1 class I SAM-dependent methyltransferase [Alphaproteobacteria bacterium]